MGCTPQTPNRPPNDRPDLLADTHANGGVWGALLIMWLLALIGVLLSSFTKIDMHGLGFISWLVFLGGIALAFFIGFTGRQ